MKFEFVERYNGVDIKRNVETGNYYFKSPWNNTQRIGSDMNAVHKYLDNYEVLESHAEALRRGRV